MFTKIKKIIKSIFRKKAVVLPVYFTSANKPEVVEIFYKYCDFCKIEDSEFNTHLAIFGFIERSPDTSRFVLIPMLLLAIYKREDVDEFFKEFLSF